MAIWEGKEVTGWSRLFFFSPPTGGTPYRETRSVAKRSEDARRAVRRCREATPPERPGPAVGCWLFLGAQLGRMTN